MKLTLLRLSTSDESTLGALYINGKFNCYTLEDTKRAAKIKGETRIPAGVYQIKLRNAGGMTKRYAKRYPDIHQGMLWLQDVEGFQWVYIHVGNKRGDTEGCILVGDTLNNNLLKDGMTGSSGNAYQRIYPGIAKRAQRNECEIEIINCEQALA